MNLPEDDHLRAHFANLREEDSNAAPPFARTASGGAAFPRRGSAWIAVAALPAFGIAVMLAVRTHRATEAVRPELMVWSSPTAFLLETPGKQFLNQTPSLGEPLMYVPKAPAREVK